jgi:hypothetical protein
VPLSKEPEPAIYDSFAKKTKEEGFFWRDEDISKRKKRKNDSYY